MPARVEKAHPFGKRGYIFSEVLSMASRFKVVSAAFIADLGNKSPKLHTIKTGLKKSEAYRLADRLSEKQGDFDPNVSREIISYIVQPAN